MILIVGGAGYLGSHLSSLLRTRCMVYDNLMYHDEFLNDIPFVYGDVADEDRLKYWLGKSCAVIWLAAIVGDAACNINPQRAIATNVNAVQFLADNFSGPIIFTSTASVYGISEERSTELSPLNPQSLYAETKVQAEEILSTKHALVLRLGTLHGISSRMRFDLVVNVMARDAVMKDCITVFGGNQSRPLLSVLTAANYIRSWVQGSWEPGIYNFATENVTIDQIAATVQNQVFGSRVERLGSDYEDKRDYSMSWDKMHNELTPVISRYGIARSAQDVSKALNSGRIKNPYSDKYVNARVQNG